MASDRAVAADGLEQGADGGGARPWQVLSHLVRSRRSNLRIDPSRPVPPGVVEGLLELACWAPNHKHTHPWRFAVVTGAGRARLGEAAAAGLPRLGLTDPAVLEKTRQKYLRAPVVVVAGAAAHAVPHLHRENHDAVAAGVQNLLLGATALGLASFWSTGAPVEVPEVKRLVGLQPEDDIVAFVYLGWPLEAAPPGRRPAPTVTYLPD
jgi:nitroreductase